MGERWEWIVTPFPLSPPTVPTVLTFFHIVLPMTGDATGRVPSKSQKERWGERWEWIVTPFPSSPPTVPTVLTFFHIVLPTTGDATRRVSSKSQNRAAVHNDQI